MAIKVTLELMQVKHKTTSRPLAQVVGKTETNQPLLKSGKLKGARVRARKAICRELDSQPGDGMAYVPDEGEDPTRSQIYATLNPGAHPHAVRKKNAPSGAQFDNKKTRRPGGLRVSDW